MARILIFFMAMLLSACSQEHAPLQHVEHVCTLLDSGSTIDEIDLSGITDSDLLNGIILYCPDYTTEVEAFLDDRN